jgi:hypothetical protein
MASWMLVTMEGTNVVLSHWLVRAQWNEDTRNNAPSS